MNDDTQPIPRCRRVPISPQVPDEARIAAAVDDVAPIDDITQIGEVRVDGPGDVVVEGDDEKFILLENELGDDEGVDTITVDVVDASTQDTISSHLILRNLI